MKDSINAELGRLDCWKSRSCVDCGRRPAKSMLNIEAAIHHGAVLRCLDRKSCERLKRKRA